MGSEWECVVFVVVQSEKIPSEKSVVSTKTSNGMANAAGPVDIASYYDCYENILVGS
jgi:hypothetical protein